MYVIPTRDVADTIGEQKESGWKEAERFCGPSEQTQPTAGAVPGISFERPHGAMPPVARDL